MNGSILRGEIYYIEGGHAVGSEQYADRPGIIVSNDVNNRFSKTFEVVFLTTKEKKPLPTHARIESSKYPSIALCEQIMTVSIERIGRCMGRLTAEEQKAVDQAMMVSIALCPVTRLINPRYLLPDTAIRGEGEGIHE